MKLVTGVFKLVRCLAFAIFLKTQFKVNTSIERKELINHILSFKILLIIIN